VRGAGPLAIDDFMEVIGVVYVSAFQIDTHSLAGPCPDTRGVTSILHKRYTGGERWCAKSVPLGSEFLTMTSRLPA
jgi:hypothetical protein